MLKFLNGRFAEFTIIPFLTSNGPGDPIPIAFTLLISTLFNTASTVPNILFNTACSPSAAFVATVSSEIIFPSKSTTAV